MKPAGACRGIGHTKARRFARAGWRVNVVALGKIEPANLSPDPDASPCITETEVNGRQHA
ncbi:hypothetical protein [Thalassovita sp.]|uniref:hypothetical protein n=1 Tax=Thalassovita sp. TaxID=1979401 RepID=UPI0029DE86BB|nr:hypothetical protein [Thalassovita sp.]